MLSKDFTFVDIETTGTSLRNDRIIEIALIRTRNNEVIKTFSSLIDPQMYISDYIMNLTGITREQVDAAPSFYDVEDYILEMLEDSYFIAHNVSFDYAFVKKEFEILGHPFNSKKLCTVRLSRALYPAYKRHNLDAIIKNHNLICESRHRALGDAKVLVDFFQKVLNEFSVEKVTTALDYSNGTASIPVNLDPKEIDNIPEAPGVYIFYGQSEIPLYVGKSNSLKSRIRSHFYDSVKNSTELKIAQQTEHIEWIPTGGELAALLKESDLVKKLQPLYNRKLRRTRNLLWLKRITTNDGYESIEVKDGHPALEDLEDCLGIFRSKQEIKENLEALREKHALCSKLLNLEKTASACFSHHLGGCKGACVGKERPIHYNIRFYDAFFSHKIKPWPFGGPIQITEYNEDLDVRDIFYVDKWCLMDNDQYSFDLDTFKILYKYIFNKGNQSKIKSLSPSQV